MAYGLESMMQMLTFVVARFITQISSEARTMLYPLLMVNLSLLLVASWAAYVGGNQAGRHGGDIACCPLE
jgi:hypothetical protein